MPLPQSVASLYVMGSEPTDSRYSEALEPVLSDSRRRDVLELLAADHALALTDLAESIAEREQGVAITDVPAETVARIRTTLHHNHLPKLADAHLIVYVFGGPGHWAILPEAVRRDRLHAAVQDRLSESP